MNESLLNRIIHGDCLEVMGSIADKSIKLICADLPYGTTNCKWDVRINLVELWKHYKRIIQPNGVIALFAQCPFDKILGASNLPMLKYEWIWEKANATGHLNSKKMPMKAHENILIFYNEQPTYNPIKTQGHKRKVSLAKHKANCIDSEVYNKSGLTSYDSTERFPRSVIKIPSDKQKCNIQPTQKPVSIYEFFLNTYTNEGDTTLDNCSGSGTHAIACINTKRNFIDIEKDATNYNNSIIRLRNHIKIN